ncbi:MULTISPECIES: MurR/RpiR family transcriptional regulator [Sneathiella]|uniref:MurR/RpiR family transcriptional regulator n=1 Tax=Sneathiella TaxID=510690 RepID=UPI001C670E55|nr:MurR/RpiR family transcriptional regulator [Sneathiella aquimaris]
MSQQTIADRLQNQSGSLTRAERQLADIILKNYPVSGLGTITTLAEAAKVSTPTVARLVQKLGYTGFPEFQASLRQELDAKISGPIRKRDIWANKAPDEHIINRFTDAVIGNIRQSLNQIDLEAFNRCCEYLSDTDNTVYIVGGRITRTLADYFFLHMQVIREKVIHISSSSNAWAHYLLDIKEGDVVVIFDVRRYETSTQKLAEMVSEKGARIILFTDQWHSPVAGIADVLFSNQIAVPSAWDSSVTSLLMMEIIIAEVQERNWSQTRKRMETLEDMFDRTRFFRKFT